MLKAIETRYNGYRFRSRLEARWAVFFDAMGIAYRYEPEGVELEAGLRYLPDFWLPDHGFVEIKPTAPTEGVWSLVRRLAASSGTPAWLCWGDVWIPYDQHERERQIVNNLPAPWGDYAYRMECALPDGTEDRDAHVWKQCHRCGVVRIYDFTVIALAYIYELKPDDDIVECRCSLAKEFTGLSDFDTVTPLLREAYRAARGARFEFGETPVTPTPVRPPTPARVCARVGDRLTHPEFGDARVLNVKALGADADVTMKFEDGNIRTLSWNWLATRLP